MILKFCVLLFLAAEWFATSALDTSSMTKYDCSGALKQVCRKPFTCRREFESHCPMIGSFCCPERRSMGDLRALNKWKNNCRDRKCLKFYNGWWDNPCDHSSRTMFYCSKTDKFCCTAACRIQWGCTTMGGDCVSNRNTCDGIILWALCKGHSCYCCVPAQPASNTTGTANNKTTEPSSPTTASPTTVGATLPPCGTTGEPGVVCDYPASCADIGTYLNGMYDICPVSNCPPVKVMCMGDGWTVILSRNTSAWPRCNFQRNWNEYKQGFCSGMDEYWIGNEALHTLTGSAHYKMMIHGVISHYNTRTLLYKSFSVGNESTNYRLTIGGFDETASDGYDIFVDISPTNFALNGMMFSTYDQDNDYLVTGSCSANEENGGWWFNDCSAIRVTRNSTIFWHFWDYPEYYPLGPQQSLSYLVMKIRPY